MAGKNKTVNLIFILISLAGIFVVILFQSWLQYIQSTWSISDAFYILFLCFVIAVIRYKQYSVDKVLEFAFRLFILAAFFAVIFSQFTVGETLMKLDFVIWLVGLWLSLWPYLRHGR